MSYPDPTRTYEDDQRQMKIDAAMEIGLTEDEAEDAVDVFGSDIEEIGKTI